MSTENSGNLQERTSTPHLSFYHLAISVLRLSRIPSHLFQIILFALQPKLQGQRQRLEARYAMRLHQGHTSTSGRSSFVDTIDLDAMTRGCDMQVPAAEPAILRRR